MKNVDRVTLFIAIILTGIGLLMVYSSSAFSSLRATNTSTFFLKKQLFPLLIGAVFCVLAAKIDYHFWGKYAYFILGATILILIAVLLFGPPVNGVRRWLRFKDFSIQPSEFAKLGIVIFTAHFIAKRSHLKWDTNNFKRELLPLFLILIFIFLLTGLEPSFGVLSVLCIVSFALLFLGKVRLSYIIIPLLIVLVIGLGAVNYFPYAKARIVAFFSSDSYQLRQSIYGIGAGGFWGAGLGNGKEKLFFLPYPHTDFIFSIIGEELGFLGSIGVSILFLVLLLRGIRIGCHAADQFGFLLAAGISLVIFISACIHIGVTCGIFPTTGLPLPFISFGGSNLLVNLIGVGILLNISRQEEG